MLTGVGYAASGSRPGFLWLASLGLVINWFGDSLDGTVARLRRIERPRYGYYLDNSIDCVAQLLLALGIGLSGYVRFDLCLLALVAYLMVSVLSFIRANVSNVFQITYAAVGPTEVRVGFIVLNALLIIFPPDTVDWGLPLTYPNLWSLAWSSAMLVTFMVTMVKQVRQLATEEPGGMSRRLLAERLGSNPTAGGLPFPSRSWNRLRRCTPARFPILRIASDRQRSVLRISHRTQPANALPPFGSVLPCWDESARRHGSATSCANSDKAG